MICSWRFGWARVCSPRHSFNSMPTGWFHQVQPGEFTGLTYWTWVRGLPKSHPSRMITTPQLVYRSAQWSSYPLGAHHLLRVEDRMQLGRNCSQRAESYRGWGRDLRGGPDDPPHHLPLRDGPDLRTLWMVKVLWLRWLSGTEDGFLQGWYTLTKSGSGIQIPKSLWATVPFEAL